jgi:hypothetical protein
MNDTKTRTIEEEKTDLKECPGIERRAKREKFNTNVQVSKILTIIH